MEISILNKKGTTYRLSINADLLEKILEKASSLEDFVRFGAVAKSWRSATLTLRPRLDYQSLGPWMALDFKKSEPSHRFHILATGEQFQIELPPEITQNTSNCWGSPFGWIFRDGLLFNPISRASIRLPSILEMGDSPVEIVRAVLTASPDSPNCIVFVSSKRNLVYCRPGDCKWSPMKGEKWSDIIYFKGNLYACSCNGKVFLISGYTEASYSGLAMTLFAAAPWRPGNGSNYSPTYLVEVGGELCVVARYSMHVESGSISFRTLAFEIYKLDTYSKKWERVSSLGDKCIFVGANYSYSIRASSPHLRANCVFFSDDYSYYFHRRYGDIYYPRINEMGFYDLGSGQVTTFANLLEEYGEKFFILCPTFWFSPTLR